MIAQSHNNRQSLARLTIDYNEKFYVMYYHICIDNYQSEREHIRQPILLRNSTIQEKTLSEKFRVR